MSAVTEPLVEIYVLWYMTKLAKTSNNNTCQLYINTLIIYTNICENV